MKVQYLILIGILALSFGSGSVDAVWWNSNFYYCRNILIANTTPSNIPEELPITLILNTTNFNYSNANADGSDIRLVGAACSNGGTLLKFNTTKWNTTGNSTIIFTTGVENLTNIAIYYHNTTAQTNVSSFNASNKQQFNTTHDWIKEFETTQGSNNWNYKCRNIANGNVYSMQWVAGSSHWNCDNVPSGQAGYPFIRNTSLTAGYTWHPGTSGGNWWAIINYSIEGNGPYEVNLTINSTTIGAGHIIAYEIIDGTEVQNIVVTGTNVLFNNYNHYNLTKGSTLAFVANCDGTCAGDSTDIKNLTIKHLAQASTTILEGEITPSNIINLTFDRKTNITISWSNGSQYYNDTDSIYNATTNYPQGQIAIIFNNNNQAIYLENNWVNGITKDVTVETEAFTGAITQLGYLWSQQEDLENQAIEIYKPINNTYKLYQTILAARGGAWQAKMIEDIYLFRVNKTGYNLYSELKPISTSTLYLYLVRNQTTNNLGYISTNCPLKTAQLSTTCQIVVATSQYYSTVRFLYYLNDIWQTPITKNDVGPYILYAAIMPITLTPTNYRYNVTIEINGNNVSSIITEYENLSSRPVQVDVPSQAPSRNELLFVIIIIQALAATLAFVGNTYFPGSGVYIYGLTLATFAGVIGALWMAGIVAGFLLVISVGKRIVG